MVKIAILGPGTVGSAVAKALSSKGHQIVFATRDPASDKIKKMLDETKGSTADIVANALKDAEVVFLTTPWSATEEVLKNAGNFNGKVLVDATNPIGPNLTLAVHGTTSGAEEVSKWATGARVVKAFNTIGCEHYLNPQFGTEKADLYVCSSDADAKKLVMGLGAELGFEPIDCGPITTARMTEPLALLWIFLAYPMKWGRNHAFKLIRK